MKTLFNALTTSILLGACALASSLAVAQHTGQTNAYFETPAFESAVFPAAAPSKMWVYIAKKERTRPLQVELLNQKGEVLASERYSKKQPTVCTRFDLSDVGDGIYTFRISDGHQTQERTFKLATPGFEEQLPKRLITMNDAPPGTTIETGVFVFFVFTVPVPFPQPGV